MRRDLGELSDEKLMAMVKQKDPSAMGELYSRHGHVVRTALQRTLPGANAEDIAELGHEVFIALYDSADKYEERTRFRSWLYSIAVRKAKHWNRKHWVRRGLLRKEFLHRQQIDSAQHALSADKPATRHAVEQAMNQLRPKLKDVFWLHTVEGFTAPEIGQMLKVSEQVVWTRLHRARKKLYEILKEERDG